jgi:hypothetical protein
MTLVKHRIESKSQFSFEFNQIQNSDLYLNFFFKICCDLVQVINIKVASNDVIYLLVKFHNF